jgi:hypothetical protein
VRRRDCRILRRSARIPTPTRDIRSQARMRARRRTRTMHAFSLFILFWLTGWTVFLSSLLCERDGRRLRPHTLFDDIETRS